MLWEKYSVVLIFIKLKYSVLRVIYKWKEKNYIEKWYNYTYYCPNACQEAMEELAYQMHKVVLVLDFGVVTKGEFWCSRVFKLRRKSSKNVLGHLLFKWSCFFTSILNRRNFWGMYPFLLAAKSEELTLRIKEKERPWPLPRKSCLIWRLLIRSCKRRGLKMFIW